LGEQKLSKVVRACKLAEKNGVGIVTLGGFTSMVGEMLGRERVAVAGFDASAMAKKLNQYCTWYRRIKVLG